MSRNLNQATLIIMCSKLELGSQTHGMKGGSEGNIPKKLKSKNKS